MAKRASVTPIRTTEPARDRVIADSDKAYHAKLVVQYQATLKVAQEAEQAFAKARTDLIAAEGAMQSWSVHLKDVYGLAEGDGVTPDGKILTADQLKALQAAQQP